MLPRFPLVHVLTEAEVHRLLDPRSPDQRCPNASLTMSQRVGFSVLVAREVTRLALRAAYPMLRCPDLRIRQISCKPTSRHGVVARLVRKRAFPKSIVAE